MNLFKRYTVLQLELKLCPASLHVCDHTASRHPILVTNHKLFILSHETPGPTNLRRRESLFSETIKKKQNIFFVTQKARNYTVKPQNLNIWREGSQGIGMHKYGKERVLILQFVKKWFMACRYLESISFSHVWNLMLNVHKQGGAKLYGNTGCYVLRSGVLCVLFYTELLPFSLFFSWSAVYGPIWTHRNWLLVSLIRCFVGALWVVCLLCHF